MRMYMPWETYRKLTPLQRDEYNLRFANAKGVSIQGVSWLILFLGLLATNLLFVSFLIITNPSFEHIKLDVIVVLQMIMKLILGTGWAIVIVLLGDLVGMVFQYVQYRKWLHTNKIKREYVWEKWLEKLK